MKRGATLFLRGVIILIGLAALAVCIFFIPGVASRDAAAHPESAYLQYPFLASTYGLAVLLFAALYQAFKLLGYIDRNKAFSEPAVKALNRIKQCAMTVCIILAAGLVFVAFGMDGDRAGAISMGLICTFVSSVIAVFAAVLRRLLHQVVLLQDENELIV
ncbi:DUF2975 domain-containing protein [Paenibacillus ginsengarvi]|uniref:DUF2975 domain-containing protein n=1 Tax=Paenibacillus ginsengarvi TaxID=400777 RepID=A0A3B0B1K8_9BACL|nr:DUF2975 domain-containing protein [Paenibacillus ginsengarvi]RKN66069.1 DUF2975 domain-containing protein [Paenibacillus ginsengarvi]